jgi:ABC-type dipeptide/oligopeptide/nickel transport system permease component
MLLAIAVGIPLGILSARYPDTWIDRVASVGAYLGISFPVYWVGLVLILVFAVALKWLPPSGFGNGNPVYLILPALALGTRSIAVLARQTRSAVLESLGADYVRTARAKGMPERAVVWRHALRPALIPVITVLGLDVGYYLTGSILTETVFSWPGLGRYVVNAIARRDLPAIQGSVLFLSVVFVIVNLLTDIMYTVVDPRVRYE